MVSHWSVVRSKSSAYLMHEFMGSGSGLFRAKNIWPGLVELYLWSRTASADVTFPDYTSVIFRVERTVFQASSRGQRDIEDNRNTSHTLSTETTSPSQNRKEDHDDDSRHDYPSSR